jgi:hypothetical protein
MADFGAASIPFTEEFSGSDYSGRSGRAADRRNEKRNDLASLVVEAPGIEPAHRRRNAATLLHFPPGPLVARS